MRQFILIAAVVLMSASAHADGPRGLSQAANNETAAAEQSKVAEKPVAGDAAAPQLQADQAKPDQAKAASDKIAKPKHTRDPLEVRVIDELHRHGVTW
jgi:hypothetical protein